jgi:predicted nucleotidyltransferase
MTIKEWNFLGLLEDLQQALIKEVDLMHLSKIEINSPIFEEIKKGIVFYSTIE